MKLLHLCVIIHSCLLNWYLVYIDNGQSDNSDKKLPLAYTKID